MTFFKKIAVGVTAMLCAATCCATQLLKPEVTIIAPDVWYTGQSVITVVDVKANDFGHTKFGYFWTDFDKVAPFVKAAYRNLNGRWENITGYMVTNKGVVHPDFWCVDGVHTVRLDLQYNPKYPEKYSVDLKMNVKPGAHVNGWQSYNINKPIVIFNKAPQ